jgi:flagellar protein FliO/FliZ
MKTSLLTILLLLAPQLLLAADKLEEPSLLASALKMVAALVVIIGLLLLFYAASRKGFGILPKQRSGSIKVLETRPLGGRKFLCLVSVRGQELLLGISNERIENLGAVPARAEFADALQEQVGEKPG